MPDYRRAYLPGGTFFFTLVTERRARFLCLPGARAVLRGAILETRRRWPFDLRAGVLLPDHLHMLWSLPERDANFSGRLGFLKKEFTKGWLARGGAEQPVSASRRRHRRRGVWQRKFWEHTIRDETDFVRYCDYVPHNPVKHGLVTCPHFWPWSSFHRFVKESFYEPDWHCVCDHRPQRAGDYSDLEETAME